MIRRVYNDSRFVFLVLLLITIGGIAGFTTRAELEDPTSRVRWGFVTTHLPGAIPTEVEAGVSVPIENVLRNVTGLRSIESSSMPGVSVVFIRLTDEVLDVDESWAAVRDKLTEVAASLPEGTSTPLLVEEQRWESYSTLVALIDKTANGMEPAVLARWSKELENRLRFVSGTRYTELFGLPDEEILVELSEESIAATGLTIAEVADKIQQRDSKIPNASAQTSESNIAVGMTGEVDDLNRLKAVMLRGNADGKQLQLSDVASIFRGERSPARSKAFVEGRRAVVAASRMDVDSQIDAWTRSQGKVLQEVEKLLPAGLEMRVLFSQQRYTKERSQHLYVSLGLGMVLVVIVVCVLMGWRAAIPICSALPLTMLGVFFLMIPFGIGLHQMSIAGLILALGILIDNPIIVVDSIQRRIKAGATAPDAMSNAVKHVTKPLVASNVTTILAFAPILLIPGPTGEYLGQLGWAVIACLVVSLALSLTIIPILAARSLDTKSNAPAAQSGTLVSSWYVRTLSVAFRYPILIAALSVILPVLGFAFAGELREQFFPAAERDHFHFSIRLPSYSSIQDTQRIAMQSREIIMQHEEIEDVSLFVGNNAPKIHYSMIIGDENRRNFAQGIVQTKTRRVDPHLIRRIQAELDEEFSKAQVIVGLFEQGPPAPAPIEFRVYGPSLEQLSSSGDVARRILMTIPGVVQTRASLDPGSPQFSLDVEQHEAQAANISDEIIAQQIFNQLEGVSLTNLSENIEEIPIRVRISDGDTSSPERVISLPLISSTGEIIPLGSVAQWSINQQIFHIHRRNSSNCNVISGYVAAGELPVVIENEFKQALRVSGFKLPPGYKSDFGGISQHRNSAVGNLLAYAAIISTIIIAILVLTFGSFRQAAIIGLVGILSVGLGLLSLWIFSYPIGIVSIIGVLGLMGLAINDSIVVLTDCKADAQEGKSLAQSVGSSTRHVLTTTFTTVAGVLPLILAGGDFWPPMMIVIAGGVVGATLLALGLTPSVLKIVNRCQFSAPDRHGHQIKL